MACDTSFQSLQKSLILFLWPHVQCSCMHTPANSHPQWRKSHAIRLQTLISHLFDYENEPRSLT